MLRARSSGRGAALKRGEMLLEDFKHCCSNFQPKYRGDIVYSRLLRAQYFLAVLLFPLPRRIFISFRVAFALTELRLSR